MLCLMIKEKTKKAACHRSSIYVPFFIMNIVSLSLVSAAMLAGYFAGRVQRLLVVSGKEWNSLAYPSYGYNTALLHGVSKSVNYINSSRD